MTIAKDPEGAATEGERARHGNVARSSTEGERARQDGIARSSTFHALQRRLATLLPNDTWLEPAAPLELASLGAQEAPRLISASLLEGRTLRAHPVGETPVARFAAFLDGTQTSRPVAHVDGVPIVHGVIAAVVRERVDRRLRTWWSPRVERRVYAPLALLPEDWRAALRDAEIPLVDTLEGRDLESPHPFALQDAAVHAVQQDREAVERELAERWCAAAPGELLVDGSISGSDRVATSDRAIGVVKSHRTLYAEGAALRCVLRLAPGERSSVFRVTSPRRTAVASWYLRLRDAAGRDPLWGLVRVEVAEHASPGTTFGRRADAVSSWVLAETLPLAVPDARWDKMVYGIRDCEEFLRAIQ